MMKKFSELKLEEWIEKSLLDKGFTEAFVDDADNAGRYDPERCLIGQDVIDFVRETQPKKYERLVSAFGDQADNKLLTAVERRIAKYGIIDALREGVGTQVCDVDLVYFKPRSTMNPEHEANYRKNRFVVVRQLHYSTRSRKSLDMVLFLNGIPLITMELKNQLTGQTILDAEKQYRKDRDPLHEPLLKFQRCLVHFCVDNDRVSMTTSLRKEKTRFLPYNKGITNPVVQDDYASSYLWNEVLTPDSLLDIVQNFALVSEETSMEWDAKSQKVVEKKSKIQIFPRYHQLDVIRKLRNAVRAEGVGHNYLIQHTTGSGKSYSIGWLSHLLASLYKNPTDTKRLFDTILVITDRKVLDRQLQRTIGQLEQTKGVVNKVEEDSAQLKRFLESGKDIIITTIQKFPYVSKVISELRGSTFAVVIDEVHSSQSGETAKHLKQSLTVQDADASDSDAPTLEDLVEKELQARGPQPHISYFGFTGTPKNKTLELFGRKNADGAFVPFHFYTMQQSIAEKFTLDVLKNYTTLHRYFRVLQKSEGDQELPESKVKRQLVNFVDSHPKRISNVVAIILDHFVEKASKEIMGTARGMVVVRSRRHCVLFQEEMVKQMRERNLTYSCLVAFSGSIHHNGRDNTESQLNAENGMEGSDIPTALKSPQFRLLIVSNKFQTGFDEPLLQSMYVDKKLSGVQCVQTLSRLNRTARHKTKTFVLDFANQADDIVKSFQPYFTSTVLEEETDPDKLVDLVYEIEQFNLYTKRMVDEACSIIYSRKEDDHLIQPIINEAVENYRAMLNEEEQDEFKSKVQSFIRLYAYIAQITTAINPDWEKSFAFLSMLNKKLPKREVEQLFIDDDVDLESLRIPEVSHDDLSLAAEQGFVFGIAAEGAKSAEEEKALLSEIIKELNEKFGVDLGDEDRVKMGSMQSRAKADPELIKVMKGNNSDDTKIEHFSEAFKQIIINQTTESNHIDLYRKLVDPKVFPMFMRATYNDMMASL